MKKIRWGVLGVARIATARFMPAMEGTRSAELVAIGSRSLERAQTAGARFGAAKVFGSYDALLADPGIDAVYVPLPNSLHVEWSERALHAGKHVLCEKPLCLTVADVERLRAARDHTGMHIEEAFSYRNHPQWAKIAEVLQSGVIGEPRAVQGTLAKQFLDPDDIRNNPAGGGGGLYDLGSYCISAATAVFGRAPVQVCAAIDRDPRFRTDRLTTMLLDYGGAHASFTVGTQSGPARLTHQQFSVLCSRGWLRCDFPYAQGQPTTSHLHVGDDTSHASFATTTFAFEPVNQYTLQIERFSQHVLGAEVPVWPIEDARLTLSVIEALFAAEKSGHWEPVAG